MLSEYKIEEQIEVLLEVSARLNDPRLFHRGSLNHGRRRCTIGHMNQICLEKYGNPHNDIYTHMVINLNKMSNKFYPPVMNITFVNDQFGRLAAKNVVDETIRELKNGG